MTKEMKQNYTLRISQANKSELVVIVYEMLLTYIEDAKAAHANGDTEALRYRSAGQKAAFVS